MPAQTSVRLFVGPDFNALWDEVVYPWCERMRSEAWRQGKPVAVVTPSRNYGFFLKHRLLESGFQFAGLRFWTPEDARAFLAAKLDAPPRALASQDFELALAAAAEQRPDCAAARAVAQSPSSLARALEELAAAGWTWQQLGVPELEPVLVNLAGRLRQAGWLAPGQLDAQLALAAPRIGQPARALLLVGFDGFHWRLWQLLSALARCAHETTVALRAPRCKAEFLDEVWIGSWEELAGEAKAVESATEPPRPFAPIAESMEIQPRKCAGAGSVVFLMGYNVREEARAIVAQAIAFLADPACRNLGIVFPGYGALSREVAALLRQQGIAFNDTLGRNAPASPEEEAWAAWLSFQSQPSLRPLLKVLERRPGWPERAPRVMAALDRALDETMVDDPAVLAAFLRARPEAEAQEAGAELAGIGTLPLRATLPKFVAEAASALELLGWGERAEIVKRLAAGRERIVPHEFSRPVFLAWLDSASRAPAWGRDEATVHPFARVHLLTYTKADGQEWTHLILTDLNENGWPPPPEESPFLDERHVAQLNEQAVAQGSQGEGHRVARPGKALLLGPVEQRALLQRQFFSLLDSVRVGLCAAAAITDETDPARRRIPSDFLTHLYHAQTGEPLSDEAALELRRATAKWVEKCGLFEDSACAPAEAALATRRAYEARRDAQRPYDEYSFALRRPPDRSLQIPCREWERALRWPNLVWMKHVLGVEAMGLEDDEVDRLPRTRGNWVHRWMSEGIAEVAGRMEPWPGPERLRERLKRAAEATRAGIERAFAEAGRRLPEVWEAFWESVLRDAESLAAALGEIQRWPYVSAEWRLPAGTVAPANLGSLRLSGRIDLLLADKPKPQDGGRCWIVDYKTGAEAPALDGKKLHQRLADGHHVQVALYGLALAALGVREVIVSVLQPGEPLREQVRGEDLHACAPFWQGLVRMQNTGIFGLRQSAHREFGSRPRHPLATLEVDEELLRIRWKLTHPLLSPPAEALDESQED